MEQHSKNSQEVEVVAVDSDYLTLQTIKDKKLIYWPLKELSEPLEIGSKLILELVLHNEGQQISTTSTKGTYNKAHSEEMYQLLEALIN